mmetsp:Transcript_15819/g.40145  ORF Transcript_15819/g.40145 Transcript_15819/m.40145 type:complete len:210 (+) Transcript_15819:215-844(+)
MAAASYGPNVDCSSHKQALWSVCGHSVHTVELFAPSTVAAAALGRSAYTVRAACAPTPCTPALCNRRAGSIPLFVNLACPFSCHCLVHGNCVRQRLLSAGLRADRILPQHRRCRRRLCCRRHRTQVTCVCERRLLWRHEIAEETRLAVHSASQPEPELHVVFRDRLEAGRVGCADQAETFHLRLLHRPSSSIRRHGCFCPHHSCLELRG